LFVVSLAHTHRMPFTVKAYVEHLVHRAHIRTRIIQLFRERVYQQPIQVTRDNPNHDGKVGHWLEKQMGLTPNASNRPDLYGFEMKKASESKITLGDFSASEYIFSKRTPWLANHNASSSFKCTRTEFLRLFGTSKQGRYSWSGKCAPRYGEWSEAGQRLVIDAQLNIVVMYAFERDMRENKHEIVPHILRTCEVAIVVWLKEKLETKINRKFNQNGFFMCLLNKDASQFTKITFGRPFTFYEFIHRIKQGDVFFDSGMYEGNGRNYSQWRGKWSFWRSLTTGVIH
jgi:hypothetical protein